MKMNVIQAIKEFNTDALQELLDDSKSYMEVSKKLFLKTLKVKFEEAREGGCNQFDEVYFGVCQSCNKGCEAITFWAETGHYLDLFIESSDEKTVDDIYTCSSIENFIELDKEFDLSFSFHREEHVNFKPTKAYTSIRDTLTQFDREIKLQPNPWPLEECLTFFERYSVLQSYMSTIGLFDVFEYKLYSRLFRLVGDIENLENIVKAQRDAVDEILDLERLTAEREWLIWYYENKEYQYGANAFKFEEESKELRFPQVKIGQYSSTIDMKGFEYVLKYFFKIEEIYNYFMEKYKPQAIHFEKQEAIKYELETYLKLYDAHQDVVAKYGS